MIIIILNILIAITFIGIVLLAIFPLFCNRMKTKTIENILECMPLIFLIIIGMLFISYELWLLAKAL